jgi:L-alanine-DL-glutamate epimerase-like enolase superfamily enzyme
MSTTRKFNFSVDPWAFKKPFTITGYTFTSVDLLFVSISEDGHTGRGEGAGIYYLREDAASMLNDVEAVKKAVEDGASRSDLLDLLPPGGTRNAIDCALWDLEAKIANTTIWALTGIEPGATQSVVTVGVGTPDEMAAAAATIDSNIIKVKLSGEIPFERISAVRDARPDAEIIVDINQGWTFDQLQEMAPRFERIDVAMIEQPLRRGQDEELEGYDCPVPLCADESCLDTSEFEQAARRYQMINIKLDKTGGLTEAINLAQLAKLNGIDLMVGNMTGTSLAMAPGFVIAQLCKFVDLDGALFLKKDRANPLTYQHGFLSQPSPDLWG